MEKYKGVTPTLNNFGYMFNELDEYSQAFVNFCGYQEGPVLDIGAAFGIASIAAYNQGIDVVACDICPKHLSIIEQKIPQNRSNKLILKAGRMPTSINFPKGYFTAIHAGMVLHFLNPDELTQAISLIYNWLKPGGKTFVTMCSPYHGTLQKFIPLYNERKKVNETWPGAITNLRDYFQERKNDFPQIVTLIDDVQMRKLFSDSGFDIEKSSMFPKNNIPDDITLDGREFAGIIARKN